MEMPEIAGGWDGIVVGEAVDGASTRVLPNIM